MSTIESSLDVRRCGHVSWFWLSMLLVCAMFGFPNALLAQTPRLSICLTQESQDPSFELLGRRAAALTREIAVSAGTETVLGCEGVNQIELTPATLSFEVQGRTFTAAMPAQLGPVGEREFLIWVTEVYRALGLGQPPPASPNFEPLVPPEIITVIPESVLHDDDAVDPSSFSTVGVLLRGGTRGFDDRRVTLALSTGPMLLAFSGSSMIGNTASFDLWALQATFGYRTASFLTLEGGFEVDLPWRQTQLSLNAGTVPLLPFEGAVRVGPALRLVMAEGFSLWLVPAVRFALTYLQAEGRPAPGFVGRTQSEWLGGMGLNLSMRAVFVEVITLGIDVGGRFSFGQIHFRASDSDAALGPEGYTAVLSLGVQYSP